MLAMEAVVHSLQFAALVQAKPDPLVDEDQEHEDEGIVRMVSVIKVFIWNAKKTKYLVELKPQKEL